MSAPLAAGPKEPDESRSRIARSGARSGQVLGGAYRLQECIGHGGMGEVYAAEHLRLGRRLAVKILRSDHAPKAVQRFRREVQAIARLENEYIVNVLDCGEIDDDTPYLVMELLQGQDLRRLLEAAAPLPIPRAVSLVWEACQGVAAVHDAGLVHRDLKPENLFVVKRATGEDWCKVLDFGVAKQQVSSSTVEGALVGTVRYMAPEQLQNSASVSAQSDIYALGAILYECLAGRPPHSGGAVHEIMFKIMNTEPPSLDLARAEVPPDLARIVARCLSKAPERRHASARALASALAPFARPGGAALGPHVETVDLEHPTLRRTSRSHRIFLYFGAGVVGGAGLLGALTWQPSRGTSSTAALSPPSGSPAAASIAPQSPAAAPTTTAASALTNSVVTSAAALEPPRVSTPAAQRPVAPTKVKAVAVPGTGAGGAPIVIDPSSRFDSSNPYTP